VPMSPLKVICEDMNFCNIKVSLKLFLNRFRRQTNIINTELAVIIELLICTLFISKIRVDVFCEWFISFTCSKNNNRRQEEYDIFMFFIIHGILV